MKKQQETQTSALSLIIKWIINLSPVIILIMSVVSKEMHAYEITVESAEFGGCWIGEEEGETKISLFGEGRSLRLSKKHFAAIPAQLTQYLENGDIDLADETTSLNTFSVFLFCRPQASHITVNITKNGQSFCMNLAPLYDAKTETQLQVTSVFPNHERPTIAPCEGQEPGKLLVRFASTIGKNERRTCEEEIFKAVETDLDQWSVGGSFLSLQWKKAFYFREREMKETIMNIPSCAAILKASDVEYNDLRVPAGTFFPLWPLQE